MGLLAKITVNDKFTTGDLAAGVGEQIRVQVKVLRPSWVTATNVIAVTNPVWLDGDGDGRFSAARTYAQKLVAQHGSTPAKLLPALHSFDEPVAAQAASLCAAAGAILESAEFAIALKSTPPRIQRGFAAYTATQQ